MKKDNIIVLAGAAMAGIAFIAGKKAGKKEMANEFQGELLKIMVEHQKEEGSK